MIHETIHLKDFYPSLTMDPTLTTYCPDNFKEWSLGEKRKCILVIPGGGYCFVSEREAEPVALRFVGHNIACFVLKYTIAPNLKYPNPIVEAFAAIAYIRKNSEKYNIDSDKISVLGFSAGGHLAATVSCYHTSQEYADYLNISLDEIKINGCILSYPVISSGLHSHAGSIKNVSQGREDLMEKLSIEKHITKDFPKTFIWHTTFDTVVPIENSLYLAEELSKNKIFFELHIYPMLDHGQALCDRSVYNQNTPEEDIVKMKHNTQWVDNAIHFVKEYI